MFKPLKSVREVGLSRRSELFRLLGTTIRDENTHMDIAETALILGAFDRPETDLSDYRQHVQSIAQHVSSLTSSTASVAQQSAALQHTLAGEFGYEGDTESYDDMRNANLLHVIDRRRGLPVALGILYIQAARAYGADVAGLSFPSHFLIRLTARGQRTIIDPFHGGQTLTTADLRKRLKDITGEHAEISPIHYEDVNDREVLVRLQNNIKVRAIADGNLERALDILEIMRRLAPHRSELWWETAVLLSRAGKHARAITTLELYLSKAEPENGREQIEDLLKRLKARVN